MKRISVIVTTYNSAHCIERTINSILSQKGINHGFQIELIVVDDCSTDNTVDVLDKLNVLYLSTGKNSGGPNKGRNIGLRAATGDYICIADHDDEWFEYKISHALPFLDKAQIITSGYSIIDTHTERIYEKIKKESLGFVYYVKNQTFLDKLKKKNNRQNTYLGSIIFNKSLKNVFFEEIFGVVDYDWILRLFHHNDSLEICESLYKRHVTGQNLSLNGNYRQKDFYYSLMFIESYQGEYPDEVLLSHKRLYGTQARYYYLVNNMKKARFFFMRSELSLKTIAYIITTFYGSGYVKRNFNIYE